MDLLATFRTFIRIAETGSFSAVAREVGTTQPAVSRQIAALEEHLGARLFQRSTRSLTLTEDGRELLSHARLVVEAVEETEAAIGRRRSSPSGMVHLGCPAVFGKIYVAPRLPQLLVRYPELSVDLSMSDAVVDMVQDGLDLAIRVGEVQDASLVSRRIGSTTSIAVASPAYLAACGEPTHPSELSRHECVMFTRMPDPGVWTFTGPPAGSGTTLAVPVSGRLRSNGIEAVIEATIAGMGVALVPTWMMRDDSVRTRLKPILQAWQPNRRPISVVYPSRRFLAPRTRAVIDFLVEEFRLDPRISAYGEV
jgi:DNA-binding transcriptional LysR family regulator